MIKLSIHRNAEGRTLAYAESTSTDGAFRITGPKAWGGSKVLAEIEIEEDNMARFILEYAPDVAREIAEKYKGTTDA